jgi:hypothetical protein
MVQLWGLKADLSGETLEASVGGRHKGITKQQIVARGRTEFAHQEQFRKQQAYLGPRLRWPVDFRGCQRPIHGQHPFSGGARKRSSRGVSRSITFMGPPHTGQIHMGGFGEVAGIGLAGGTDAANNSRQSGISSLRLRWASSP